MKKSIFFAALMIGAFVLTGCEKSNETPEATQTEMWPAFNSEVGLYGYINKKGEWAIPAQFSAASSYFSCGFAQVQLNGKNVFIDKSGKVQAAVSFDSADEFRYGYAKASLNGKFGLIDSKLDYAIAPAYDNTLSEMTNDGIVTFQADANHIGFLDKKGNILMVDNQPVYYEFAEGFRDGYCVVCSDMSTVTAKGNPRTPTYFVIDTKFNVVIADGQYMGLENLGNGLFKVLPYSTDPKYEYDIYSINEKRNINAIKYDNVQPFSEDGYAVVTSGTAKGMIDKTGQPVVALSMDDVQQSYDGYAWARKEDDTFLMDIANSANRIITLLNKDDDNESYQCNVHNGLVLIRRNQIDSKGNLEVEYRWVDVKNNNATVFSWSYDQDSKYQGDLNPMYAPAKKGAKALSQYVFLH